MIATKIITITTTITMAATMVKNIITNMNVFKTMTVTIAWLLK